MARDVTDISVIVAAYEAAGTIGRALRSIAAQTLKPLEVVVVDDRLDQLGRQRPLLQQPAAHLAVVDAEDHTYALPATVAGTVGVRAVGHLSGIFQFELVAVSTESAVESAGSVQFMSSTPVASRSGRPQTAVYTSG